MDSTKMALIFNELMRRYIEEPERFYREWQVVSDYQASVNAGTEPTYGSECAALFTKIAADLGLVVTV